MPFKQLHFVEKRNNVQITENMTLKDCSNYIEYAKAISEPGKKYKESTVLKCSRFFARF